MSSVLGVFEFTCSSSLPTSEASVDFPALNGPTHALGVKIRAKRPHGLKYEGGTRVKVAQAVISAKCYGLTSQRSQRRAVVSDPRSRRAAVDLPPAGLPGWGSAGGGALPSLLWAGSVPEAGALRPPALLHPPERGAGRWEETQGLALVRKKRTSTECLVVTSAKRKFQCRLKLRSHTHTHIIFHAVPVSTAKGH